MPNGFSSQIPWLTPDSMRDESVLRRLTTFLQSLELQAGENINIDRRGGQTFISSAPQGGGGGGSEAATPYFFAVTAKDADEVSITAGKVINGTTVSTIAAADHTIGTTNGTYYLSIEVWYNATWKSAYLSGTSYPTQAVKTDGGSDYPCFRVLLAEVVVAGNVVGTPTQVWQGTEIINPRVAD